MIRIRFFGPRELNQKGVRAAQYGRLAEVPLLVQYAVDVPEEGVGPDFDSVR